MIRMSPVVYPTHLRLPVRCTLMQAFQHLLIAFGAAVAAGALIGAPPHRIIPGTPEERGLRGVAGATPQVAGSADAQGPVKE